VSADGEARVSIAAVGMKPRPQLLRGGDVVDRVVLELIGEIWIKDIRLASVKTVDNKVRFSAGIGANKMDRVVDLSKIGKAMR
jgi:hypothetical protein